MLEIIASHWVTYVYIAWLLVILGVNLWLSFPVHARIRLCAARALPSVFSRIGQLTLALGFLASAGLTAGAARAAADALGTVWVWAARRWRGEPATNHP